ncbi:transposable element Tcb2 transposase [Trichonephila clavipes]|nr:transposable element Tcb2 transposase [Trichonephila clavipes]
MGIHKRHISSYSAHVNGRVEKPNQSLANILASISQNTNDWDEQLPHTMLALNSAIHEATYTSPFFLEHGRDIRLSYTYEKNSDTPQNKYEYVEKLLPSLEQIFNKVLKNLKEQEASHVDLSTRATKQHHYDYKIGSLCFIKTPNIKSNLSPKLRPKFEGPYRVIESFSNVNYRVQNVEQLRKRFNTHVNRMIPFIKRFSYLHLNNSDDLQPDETKVKGIVSSPRIDTLYYIHWCAKIKDEVEKLAYQLNEEAERTERQIRRLRTAIRGCSSGRPRLTTPADDQYIVLHARRNRRQAAGEIARHTTQATARPISRFTVARRLHGGGLFARRPVRCVPLTPAHRRRHSLWCREPWDWRDNEWGRVLFTDESRFSLSSDSHRILIWRDRGSRNHPSNIIERDRYGGRGVLVWGGIMLGSRTDLHIFDAGSVNGTRYCNEILLPYVRLFRGAMGLQFLLMDDNAPCHRTVAAEQLLENEDIERMDWPARSQDLNLIEHVWDFLGRHLAACTLPPITIRELRLAMQDEWAAMPQQLIDTLILSMGRRCETCLVKLGITQECGCVGFNGPDGRQGCVLTRTVESNQGGRFDSNESVADSFPSGAVGFKSWFARILGAFPLLRLPEKTSSREANSLPEVTLRRSYPLR